MDWSVKRLAGQLQHGPCETTASPEESCDSVGGTETMPSPRKLCEASSQTEAPPIERRESLGSANTQADRQTREFRNGSAQTAISCLSVFMSAQTAVRHSERPSSVACPSTPNERLVGELRHESLQTDASISEGSKNKSVGCAEMQTGQRNRKSRYGSAQTLAPQTERRNSIVGTSTQPERLVLELNRRAQKRGMR